MRAVMAAIRLQLRRARRALKSFAYSGLARERWQNPDRVLSALTPGQGERVADLGAGGGYFTFRLASAVGPRGLVYAVDTDADMSSLIAEKATREGWSNVFSVEAQPDDPALPETVDLALLVNAFHHLPDPAAYIATLARYVRPGGRVAVIEALPRRMRFGHATEPERIRSTMTEAGYVLAEQHDFLPRQSFQLFNRPDPGQRGRRPSAGSGST